MPQLTGEAPGRITPLAELVNAFEFEAMAQRKLDGPTFSLIAAGDRQALERITLRPRVMINTTKLDLTLDLFGQTMFAPILIGPVSQQKRFHPEAELAMARGAAAAKAVMIISDRTSQPLEKIATLCEAGFWYQIYAEPDMSPAVARAKQAIALGAHAVCLTVGAAGVNWKAIDGLRQSFKAPLVLKGVMTEAGARACMEHGVQGIIVSGYVPNAVPRPSAARPAAVEALPGIADAVAGKIPILIDGGFARGADMLKALALGARAVLIARPAVWGLAGYGADGVQRITEMLQTELARDMAMSGKPNLKAIDRTTVKLHRW